MLYADAGAAYRFHAVHDGDRLELGNVLAEVMHLPGHTPEHLGLLVTDRTRAPEPWFVFTGHTLMVGDMGRTELASSAVEGARALFDSARRLAVLPDHLEVLPGAFSGSVCGFERRFNRALQVDDRDAFVALMLQDIPPRPPQAERIRSANLGREWSGAGADSP